MNDVKRSRDRRAQLLLLLVAFIWGSNYPVTKYALVKMDALVFNAFRFIVAAALLNAILFSRSAWKPVKREDWSGILRISVVASVLYQCAFIIGLSMTTAGNAAVLMSTSPLWTSVLNARLHKERIQTGVWLGMTLSLSGVVMIIISSGKKFEFGGYEMIGDMICVSAAVLWAFNTNMQKPLLTRYSPLQFAALSVVIGAIGLSLVAIPGALATEWSSLNWQVWSAVLISGGLSIGIANVFWSNGVQQIGPGKTGTFSNLIPVIAFVISSITMNEELHWIQIVGSAITVAGVWLARR